MQKNVITQLVPYRFFGRRREDVKTPFQRAKRRRSFAQLAQGSDRGRVGTVAKLIPTSKADLFCRIPPFFFGQLYWSCPQNPGKNSLKKSPFYLLKAVVQRSQVKLIVAALFLLGGCSGLEDTQKQKLRDQNAIGERICRTHDEFHYSLHEPILFVRAPYPWEMTEVGGLCRITKEFFRCKGSGLNPPKMKEVNGEKVYTFDCGGRTQHSLPIRGGKEEIYPALFDLLNYIQEATQKKIEITCGYRCPTHNTYADPSIYNQTSKHMIGAEVDFYVKGLEWSPQVVINLLMQYYKEHPQFREDPQFTQFERFEKKINVSTPPWYNKEIFVKLYTKEEGRELDNDHPYPYFSLQLKWDRNRNEAITYSWSKAFNEYLRY